MKRFAQVVIADELTIAQIQALFLHVKEANIGITTIEELIDQLQRVWHSVENKLTDIDLSTLAVEPPRVTRWLEFKGLVDNIPQVDYRDKVLPVNNLPFLAVLQSKSLNELCKNAEFEFDDSEALIESVVDEIGDDEFDVDYEDSTLEVDDRKLEDY